MTFNEDFAAAIGLPVTFIRFTFTVLTVLAITIGIQTVGVVLMAALLITPSAAARAWTKAYLPCYYLLLFLQRALPLRAPTFLALYQRCLRALGWF